MTTINYPYQSAIGCVSRSRWSICMNIVIPAVTPANEGISGLGTEGRGAGYISSIQPPPPPTWLNSLCGIMVQRHVTDSFGFLKPLLCINSDILKCALRSSKFSDPMTNVAVIHNSSLYGLALQLRRREMCIYVIGC
jgi:hypothetical protein